jgi:predicted DNA-binding ribbon-helix-helix protein
VFGAASSARCWHLNDHRLRTMALTSMLRFICQSWELEKQRLWPAVASHAAAVITSEADRVRKRGT